MAPTDDDDDIVVPGDGEVTTELSGHQRTVTRGYLYSNEGYKAVSRSYIKIAGGKVSFGDRNKKTGAMTERSSISASYNGYYGIAVSCSALFLAPVVNEDIDILFQEGGYTPVTGYMQVVTDMQFSQNDNLRWVIQKIPFRNGVCVGDLDAIIQDSDINQW